MHFEYQALAAITIFFLFAWLPVSVGKWRAFGARWLASNRTPPAGIELEAWAYRCERAYNNLKDYFPGFIVAILTLGINNKFDETTKWAALIYIVSRFGHYVVYWIGLVDMRMLFWTLSVLSNLFLLLKIFY